MDAVKGLLKLIAALIILGAITALPAFAGEYTETDVKIRFVRNTTNGIKKGFELKGKTLSSEKLRAADKLGLAAANKVVELVKAANLFDEYAAQLFDPEIQALDVKALEADSIEEVSQILEQQLQYTKEHYPRLYAWLESSEELKLVMLKMFFEMCNELN